MEMVNYKSVRWQKISSFFWYFGSPSPHLASTHTHSTPCQSCLHVHADQANTGKASKNPKEAQPE